ncbi:MAG TPA: aspartate/glutamate racemase family protein [Nitrososphaerales archaeon]|nr:aspartate/glutamate racemase family protein [Nitrososphaerales archaeon]
MVPRYSNDNRLGMIIPSLNVTIEPEFNALLPSNVSVHATRLLLRSGTKENLREMAKDTEAACDLLSSAKVGAILYACTTGSLIGGKAGEKELLREMKSSSRVPVATTAGAAVDALREVDAKRIAVATPYSKKLNLEEKKFFEENGFEVTKIEGLGYIKGEDLHSEPPETTVKLAKKVDNENSDTIFLSCTDLKTFTVIQRLEKILKKPVVSSNTANMWKSLAMLGLHDRVPALGRLLG